MILYQVCSNEGPRVQDGPAPGVLGSSQTATLKNIFCLNEGPWVQDGPAPGGPGPFGLDA